MSGNGKITWHNEKRTISELNPAPYNPRQLTEAQAKDLETSLQRFNLADPVIINKNNTIIGGHQRINIYKKNGVGNDFEVDVRVPDKELTMEQERELNLRLNKNLGEWDFDMLANFDEDLLKDVGFSSEELDKIFQLDNDPQDDDVPEARTTDIKLGDMFQLGEHRLLCGDSTKKKDVERLMAGQLADVVVTDPPYNTGMEGKPHDAKARLSHMFNDKIENYGQFLSEIFSNYVLYTKGDCAFYCFIDWRRVNDIRCAIEKLMDVKNVIVWDKVVHGLGSDYKSTYELCVVGKKGKPEINNRYGLDYQDIWRLQREMGRNEVHATAKPVELLSKPILHASKQDDICLDLFLGSGSTLIACEKLNRKCYGMEIDPVYCQVIIDRYEKYTNKKAVKIGTP